MENSKKRSKYYHDLDNVAKIRYEEKISVLNIDYDPFFLKDNEFELTGDITKWPDVTFADIFAYLINFPSSYTKSSLKAYKSLESYKYVISGLVYKVLVKEISSKEGANNFLVCGRVRHGQSQFTKTPNSSWLGIQLDGEIINAHCTCMAGLGEVCSHVGAAYVLSAANI